MDLSTGWSSSNDAHQHLFGSADWVGKPIREAFPDIGGQGFFELLDQVYASGQMVRGVRTPARFRVAGDRREEIRILDFVYAPVTDNRGVAGVFCQGFDVTEQVQAEEDLKQREEQLRLAIEAGDVGLWDVDPDTDGLFWPPRVKAMFGISPEVDVTMADFYNGLHPADRDRVTAAFTAAADPAQRVIYDVEYRTIGKEDGVVRWVAAKGRGIFDSHGKCIRVIGAALDVTERRATQESLRLKRRAPSGRGPKEGRIPRHPRPRAAQPPGADRQRGRASSAPVPDARKAQPLCANDRASDEGHGGPPGRSARGVADHHR